MTPELWDELSAQFVAQLGRVRGLERVASRSQAEGIWVYFSHYALRIDSRLGMLVDADLPGVYLGEEFWAVIEIIKPFRAKLNAANT